MLHEKVLGSKKIDGLLTDAITKFKLSELSKDSVFIADDFLKLKESKPSDLVSFLKNKEQLESCDKILESGAYQQISIFKDYSVAAQKVTGEYVSFTNLDSIKTLHKELVNEMIQDEFKKAPNTMKGMIDIASKLDSNDIPLLSDIITNYKENIDILRIHKLNIVDTYKNLSGNTPQEKLGQLDNVLSNTILDHKVKQYGMSVSSKKYEFLYDDDSFKILKDIYAKGISVSDFKKEIGPKMGNHCEPSDFNHALKNFYKEHQDFNASSVLERASKFGLTPIVSDTNSMIFKIDNFEQSKELGSHIWAISKIDKYFEMYTRDGNEQYFVFDFTKKATDQEAIIGITLNKGKVFAAHYRDCVEVEDNHLKSLVNRINTANNTQVIEVKEKVENGIKNKI